VAGPAESGQLADLEESFFFGVRDKVVLQTPRRALTAQSFDFRILSKPTPHLKLCQSN